MKTTLVIAVSIVIGFAGSVHSADAPPARAARKPIDQWSNSELIDRLTDITNKEYSLRTNIFAGDALPEGLLMLNDPALAPAKAKEELLRRGVAAMPDLLKHLDDARKTRAVITGMFGGITYSAEFDRNPRTDKPRPPGVVAPGLDPKKPLKLINVPQGNAYPISVGDLCFDIIGDIVNRGYSPVRYQPTAIIIVNSPVLCPDLRDAVRAQWTGLTAEKHRKSLVTDVISPDGYGRDQHAIYCLLHYYPDAATAPVRQRLAIPLYDFSPVHDFTQKLYTIADPAERKKQIDDFIRQHGAIFRDSLILHLWDDKGMEIGEEIPYSKPAEKVKVPPRDILTSLIGKFDEDAPPLVDPALKTSIDSFIQALGNVPSPQIDQVVWETFQKYQTSHTDTWDEADRIAQAAIVRLAHKGHDAELITYVERRLGELKQHGEVDYRLENLRTLMRFIIEPRAFPQTQGATDE
jgi:hypothetical protein